MLRHGQGRCRLGLDAARDGGAGHGAKAIIFDRTNTILAQGAAFAELTMVDRFEAGDPTALIRTGDELRIEPDNGQVTILNRNA